MISVFTPVDARTQPFLEEAARSLNTQTHQDFEWVIGLNNGADGSCVNKDDPRIRIVQLADDEKKPHNRVGRLKAELCEQCKGDILLELDADDLLMPTALEECAKAFEKPEVQFVYSNDAQFDKNWNSPFFEARYGWKHREFIYEGHKLIEHLSFRPTAQSLCRIEFSPDHFRAWRRSAYEEIGGHDPDLISGDDHELLCRTYIRYGEVGMHHINLPLYLYRVGENTSRVFNDEVQAQVAKNYVRFIYPMAMRWASDHGLSCFDLGGGINPAEGFVSVDLEDGDVKADLNQRWPFPDNRVGVIRSHHLIEHLDSVSHFFNEAYRTLAGGGWLFVEYPQAPGAGSFRDPSHIHHLNEQTLRYFSQTKFAKFIRFKGRFQVRRVSVYDIEPGVPVVAAELLALKPPYSLRPAGAILI